MNRLLTVYDDKEPLNNVVAALSLDFDEVIFVYHHEGSRNTFSNISNVIKKYKDVDIDFIQINDDNELDNYINKNTTIDVGAAKYLSLKLFDLANENNLDVIYYDDEEGVLKDYTNHTVIVKDVFKLSIEDVLRLRGGQIKGNMHKKFTDKLSKQTIIELFENNLDQYSYLIKYLSRVNSIISSSEYLGKETYLLSDKNYYSLLTDSMYKQLKNIFVLEDKKLIFKSKKIKDIVETSGVLLENYLYIKLNDSKLFDDVMMSANIDFSRDKYRYPVNCEIDCLVIKNNRLLFISCKSTKVDKEALNEIYVHNSMFGNSLSKAVLCSGEELDRKYPSTFAKGEELGVYIIDKSYIENYGVDKAIYSILDNTYKYDTID